MEKCVNLKTVCFRPGSAATLLTVPGKNGAGGGVNLAVVQQVPNKVVLQAPSPGAGGKASTITGIAQVRSSPTYLLSLFFNEATALTCMSMGYKLKIQFKKSKETMRHFSKTQNIGENSWQRF